MNRRNALTGAAGLFAVSALTQERASAQSVCDSVENPATFVLVPGAWLGAWAFRDVSSILRRRGHRVFPLSLTGLAERSHLATPDVTLETHIEDITNLIRFNELEDLVLVGHSFGGMPVTGAADRIPDRIASLVYLDALVPADGQAAVDLMGADLVGAIEVAREQGEHTLPFALPVAPDTSWQFTPHPIGSFRDPVRLTGALESISKKTYVRATGPGPDFSSIVEQLQRRPGWAISEIASGHNMMIDAPMQTALLLEQFA